MDAELEGKYDEFGGSGYEWVREQFEPGCQEEQGTNEENRLEKTAYGLRSGYLRFSGCTSFQLSDLGEAIYSV